MPSPDSDLDWIEVTTMGDNYQVEMTKQEPTQYRHRRFSFGGIDKRAMTATQPFEREWVAGKPPSGFWSKDKEK